MQQITNGVSHSRRDCRFNIYIYIYIYIFRTKDYFLKIQNTDQLVQVFFLTLSRTLYSTATSVLADGLPLLIWLIKIYH